MIAQAAVSTVWLVYSYVAVGLLGFYMGYKITCWTGEHMGAKRGRIVPANPKISAITVVLVAALVLIGIGVQQWLYQRDQDSHDACLTNWAGEVRTSLDVRSDGRQVLDDARQVRDTADSKINNAILHALTHPSTTDEAKAKTLKDLVAVYREAREANATYREAQNDYEAAIEEHPYPEAPQLACD